MMFRKNDDQRDPRNSLPSLNKFNLNSVMISRTKLKTYYETSCNSLARETSKKNIEV